MKILICKIFGHKFREKHKNRIFISNRCFRCYSKEFHVDIKKQLIYFGNGTNDIAKWNKLDSIKQVIRTGKSIQNKRKKYLKKLGIGEGEGDRMDRAIDLYNNLCNKWMIKSIEKILK